jgi:excisionase family DNA binding protein
MRACARGGRGVSEIRLLALESPAVRRLALSPDEAAAALGVSRDYLDEHVAPELRWVRRGRRKLVAVVELERWLEASGALTLERER